MNLDKAVNLKKELLLGLCLLAILVYFAPIIILGKDSYHGSHDNLDSNHVNAVLEARNIKENGLSATENPYMLGGVPRRPGPPLGLIQWLYIIFPPYAAIMLKYLLMHLTAFFGMLLLLKQLAKEDFNTHRTLYYLAALAFSLIRFWVNAGTSVAGLPLLFYGFLIAGERRWAALLIAFFYAFSSNFVLTGMFALIFLGVTAIVMDFRSRKINWSHWLYLALVFVFYLVSSYKLVLSVFGSTPLYVSHRQDYNMQHFYNTWGASIQLMPTMIFNSYGHNSGIPLFPMLLSLAVLLYCRILKSADRMMELLFGIIVGLSLLSMLLGTKAWIGIQQHIPIFSMVQLQRFYWLLVFFQYLLFFYALIRLAKQKRTWMALLAGLLQLVILFAWNVNYKQLVKKHIFHMNTITTYSEFYSVELLSQIKDYIGKPQSSYRVVSVGLEPAVALYSGFYSLEGYSGSYPIEHKRRMREVMASELAKNQVLADNFDGWGNKVTIYSDDIARKIGYPTAWDIPFITKDLDVSIDSLSIRSDLLYGMNCRYLLSALEITNCDETGLEFLESFENDQSPYRIYLYKVLSAVATAGL